MTHLKVAVGEHEKHLQKLGEYVPGVLYTVTFVSEKNTVEFFDYVTETTTLVNSGTVLCGYGLLTSNDARVEIRDNSGNVYRLGKYSEFSLELVAEGVCPVYFGEVAYSREQVDMNFLPEIYKKSGGKYRTSCYNKIIPTSFSLLVRSVSSDTDVYYNLGRESVVYEYDEKGMPFLIFKVTGFTCVELVHSDDKDMRERYVVKKMTPLSDNEVVDLTKEYLLDDQWK